MSRRVLYAALSLMAGAVLVAAMIHTRAEKAAAPAAARPADRHDGPICAAGKVEPVSEVVKIGSQVSGMLREVASEGQRVPKGQVIATLDNADYAARVAESAATVEVRRAALDRVINGARDQERREAAAAVDEARIVVANARVEMQRRQSLYQTGDVSRSEFERYEREFHVAEARVEQALQHGSFLEAPARADERVRAEADLALARAQFTEAQALLEKTVVRAPFSGTVLKRFRKAGETVSDKGDTPIVSFGDDSRLRVRVDVDETDVARLQTGDKAYFTAAAFGSRQFWGRVVQIGHELGKKTIDTGDPAEKVDTKVLETLVELDGHPPLPAGLRVDSYILAR